MYAAKMRFLGKYLVELTLQKATDETIATPAISDPDERTISQAYAGFNLDNVDEAYKEAKYTFDEQAKRVDGMTSRATWVFGTAAGLAGVIISQSKNIADIHPDGFALAGFILGVGLLLASAFLDLFAITLRTYEVGLSIQQLIERYIAWKPAHAKILWLRQWHDMFQRNEQILTTRAAAMRRALRLLEAGVLILVATGAYVIDWKLIHG